MDTIWLTTERLVLKIAIISQRGKFDVLGDNKLN